MGKIYLTVESVLGTSVVKSEHWMPVKVHYYHQRLGFWGWLGRTLRIEKLGWIIRVHEEQVLMVEREFDLPIQPPLY